jgi:hypothetical protein
MSAGCGTTRSAFERGLGQMPPTRIGAAIGIAAIVGAALGIILGYFVSAAGSVSPGFYSFGDWFDLRYHPGILWWGAFGALVGAAIAFVAWLLRAP